MENSPTPPQVGGMGLIIDRCIRDSLSSPCLKRGRGYVLTYDLYCEIFQGAAVLKLSHEL